MKKYVLWALVPFALMVPIIVIANASLFAPTPVGAPKIIAHRGLAQEFDRAGVGRDTCTATRIEQPFHRYLENTREGVLRAQKLGAFYIEVDVAPTADGEIVLFHDWTLDCRTDGTGPVREATLEELKALDIGYGYTADGGKTFPFRSKGVGQMPTLDEAVRFLPPRTRLMFNFKSDDPAEADLLAAKLEAAGRDPEENGDAFYGGAKVTARVREIYPDAWAWNPGEARQCSEDYVKLGWSGYLPESCRGGTMVIPLNYQYLYWGWPNRLIARMEAYGGEIIVTGPYTSGEPNTGLTLPEQLSEIPSDFNGYIWVEDTFNIAPALNRQASNRSPDEIEAGNAAIARRRAAEQAAE